MIKVIFNFNDKRWKKNEAYLLRAARAAMRVAGKNDGEISITLTDDSEIRALNEKYRGIDSATNVLSFESGDDHLLGDIFISYDTVMKEAGRKKFREHSAHMVVHGVLHLLGYDHLNDSDAEKMESVEIKALAEIGIENPYSNEKKKIKIIPAVLAFLLGGVCALGFAPFHLWPIFIIALFFAYILISKQNRKFWPAAAFGAGYALSNFWWVVNSIFVVPELAHQFAIFTVPALVGIAIVGALIFSIPFLFIKRGAIVFAAMWTVVLWLREWLFTGFPWNPVANITLPYPALSNSMSLWGALGLTFILVGLIASLAEIKKRGWFAPILFSSLMVIGAIYGSYNINKIESAQSASQINIRIVQPAKSAEDKATHNREEAIAKAEKNISALKNLAIIGEQKPDLIIFPETSYPYFIMQDKDVEIPFAKDLSVPTIIGTMSVDRDNGRHKVYNSMVLTDAAGQIKKIYSKSHLVPFGEYRPFGDIIPTPGQLTPGSGAEILESAGLNFVPAICYEIIFSDSLIPSQTMPDAIINITNDTWFGKTSGTHQHLDMARRHAIEVGLPIIRANYSGISAFISADGKIMSALAIGESGILDGTVSAGRITPYRIIGRDLMMIIILIFSIGASAIPARPKKG